MKTTAALFFLVMAVVLGLSPGSDVPAQPTAEGRFQVPPGFVVEKVAGPPLVRYPMFAAFDERGRLFVAEGTGTNLPGKDLVPRKLGRITLLEDTDGDGKFDKRSVFVDQLIFPTGVLWHDGALYATSHPSLWRFTDTKGTGQADRREVLAGNFNFNGNGCDIHGPFLGPDGRLYWTDGRHGYKIKTCEGELLEGLASRIWRCRTDGTDMERLCGGGFDNPVELAFTPEGDLIGTMDQGPGDALLHYVEGGVYPMEHPSLKEFPMTGPLLGAVRQYSAALPVALCGLNRYRSGHFGPEYKNVLFTAQFNVHRIQQHTLVRDGSTYRSSDKDFLVSSDYDTHFTDVLEDADGSLLVVDMGAWFNYGCPTSKIAKPEVLGAIYRVRRKDAPAVPDPWGKNLKLESWSVAQLTKLLDDPRFQVRDQVVTKLGKCGSAAVPALAAVAADQQRSVQARRNAVWALCRIRSPEARAAVRTALADKDAGVRQAAIHAAGVEKDAQAGPILANLAVKDELPLRLKAAEALGRIGQDTPLSSPLSKGGKDVSSPLAKGGKDVSSPLDKGGNRGVIIPALLESLRRGGADRFLEHALIYALIRINDPRATLPALDDPNPRVRQAGLIALDQMKDGRLTREAVVPLLDTDDPDLQQAVLGVISKQPQWAKETVGLLKEWLASPKRSAGQERSLTGALLAFSGQEEIQKLVVETLNQPATTTTTRFLLLSILARSRLDQLPPSWLAALGQALTHADLAIRREAIATIRSRNLSHFDKQLSALSRQSDLPAELRLAALECIAARQGGLPAESFALLVGYLGEKAEPLVRMTAARALGASTLSGQQLLELCPSLSTAGPTVVPLLAPAFTKNRDAKVGLALVEALKRAPGTDALARDDLEAILKRYPDEVQTAAAPLRQRLALRQQEQAAYLTKLTAELLQVQGNVDRGKEVFFSKKAACYGCHRTLGKGGNVGPDLSQIGRFRTPRDLLESIVYPSSAIIPDFRAYVVVTKAGQSVTGMIARESAEALFLRTADLAEIRVPRQHVDELASSRTSIMPEGLEKVLSRQELSDLLEFLYHQR